MVEGVEVAGALADGPEAEDEDDLGTVPKLIALVANRLHRAPVHILQDEEEPEGAVDPVRKCLCRIASPQIAQVSPKWKKNSPNPKTDWPLLT